VTGGRYLAVCSTMVDDVVQSRRYYLHYRGRIPGFMYHGKSLSVGVGGVYLGLLLLVSGYS